MALTCIRERSAMLATGSLALCFITYVAIGLAIPNRSMKSSMGFYCDCDSFLLDSAGSGPLLYSL